MPVSDFLQQVTGIFSRGIGVAVVFMIVSLLGCTAVHDKLYHGKRTFPIRRVISIILFSGYLTGLITITLFLRTTGSTGIQWHLFRSFWEAWNHFDIHFWTLFLGNIAMFMPLGSFLPLLFHPFRRWYVTIPTGFGVSLLIEAAQLIFQLGSADVDDLFCNTLGTVLGYCLCMVGISLYERKPVWNTALYGVFPLLSAAALVGIFITYYTQPYGTLTEGPSFVVDTSGVEWVLDCDLSDEPREVDIYYAEPFSPDSCFTFAETFAERENAVSRFIFNYDDSAYFEYWRIPDGTGFSLEVNYADRSYHYSDYTYIFFNPETGRGETFPDDGNRSEGELRTALLKYGIDLPNGAVLSYDGNQDPRRAGWYTFRADYLIEGNILTDGTVSCKVTSEGEIAEIVNSLSISSFQAVESILSEADAYERLRQGRFSPGRYFENLGPSKVRILSCTLDYLSDTKGFRQPVYWFELEGMNSVFVPALRDYWGP